MTKTSTMKKALSAVLGSVLAFTLAVTGIMPGTGAIQAKAESNDQVTAFVERMYTQALGREAEEAGKADWTNKLLSHTDDGAGLAFGFIRSEEFTNRNLSNEEYLTVLYKTFFNREPDEGGYNDWLSQLKEGTPREKVLSGFVDAREFTQLCVDFDISRGYMFETGAVADPGVGLFVYRLYDKLLGRKPDAVGLDTWTNAIATNAMSATKVAATQFIDSQEFQNRQQGLSNSEYVDVLYSTFFDRPADEGGKAYWLEQLSYGAERTNIVSGFAGSSEFKAVQQQYNIEAAEPEVPFVPVEEPEDYTYWSSTCTKRYLADGTIIARTDYLFDEAGRYLGYEEYNAIMDSDSTYGDLRLSYEYKNEYNAASYIALTRYTRYGFNSDGRYVLSNEIYHYDGTEMVYTTYFKSQEYDFSGKLTAETETNYNEGNRANSVTKYYDYQGRVTSERNVTYDKFGNEIDVKTVYHAFSSDPEKTFDNMVMHDTFTYDDNGYKIHATFKQTNYDADGSVSYDYNGEEICKYENGKLVESLRRSDKQNEAKSEYSYDANGNQIYEASYGWLEVNGVYGWRLQSWTECKVNELGKVAQRLSYYSLDGTKERSNLTYRYDYEYKKINNYIAMVKCDSYFGSSTILSPENGGLTYMSGYENIHDDDGFCSEYRNYMGDGKNGKVLNGLTKYLKVNLPDSAQPGTELEFRTTEDYSTMTGELSLHSYEMKTFRAFSGR